MVGTAEAEVKGQEEGGHKGEQGTQDKVRMCFINVFVISLVRKSRNYYQSCCEIMVLLLHTVSACVIATYYKFCAKGLHFTYKAYHTV